MTDPRQRLGQRGEAWVASRIAQAGYTILDRNWRHGTLGELDIIARHGDTIIFVEVRTRRGPLAEAVAQALESVDERKQARLAELALAYLAEHSLDTGDPVDYRIDVAAVGYDSGTFSMEVIKHAVDW